MVAHENVLSEMRKYETGLFRWSARTLGRHGEGREDVKATRLKPPSLLYRDVMIFDDGTHRVELRYFGVGHTHGDGFAWLPKERILFTGDAAVNGPLQLHGRRRERRLGRDAGQGAGARRHVVAPGHGPVGDGGVLEAQRQYFVALRAEVEKRKGLAPDRVQADVPAIRTALLPRHATYIDAHEK